MSTGRLPARSSARPVGLNWPTAVRSSWTKSATCRSNYRPNCSGQAYAWPGNVRELENRVERAVILSRDNRLELGDWFPKTGATPSALTFLEENERQHILDALEHTGWRMSGEKGAAKLLDVNSNTLVYKMRKLGIQRTG